MNRLTKAEEQVMQILWKLKRGLVHDVIGELPEPKPAYNTVSTVIRVLEKKGFVDHKAYGNTYEYFPLIDKDEYTRVHFRHFMKDYFDNSFPRMAAFFAKEYDMDLEEMEEMLKMAGMDTGNNSENNG